MEKIYKIRCYISQLSGNQWMKEDEILTCLILNMRFAWKIKTIVRIYETYII